jgi:hypothetical protein
MKNISLILLLILSLNLKAQTFNMPLVVGTDVPSEHSYRFATFYDSNLPATGRYINFGKNNTSYNSGEISFTLVGENSTNNLVTFGFYGQPANQRFYFRGDGNLGIGTGTPYYKLDVNGMAHINNLPLIVGNDYPYDQTLRFAMFYDNTMNSNAKYINFGKNNTNYNCGEMAFNHISDNSVTNFVSIGLYGQTSDQRIYLRGDGNFGIGTTNPEAKLTVKGKIEASEIQVKDISTIPDNVFKPDYKLMSLNHIEEFVKQNQHLPDVPSEKEFKEKGMNMVEMNVLLLKKIEELTLYVIEQNKHITDQNTQLQTQDKRISDLDRKIKIMLKNDKKKPL